MKRIKTIDDFQVNYRRKITLKGCLESNELFIGDGVILKGSIVFDFRSKKTNITIGENTELHNVTIATNGLGSKVELGSDCKWKGFLLSHGKNSSLIIGKESTSIETFILARDGNVNIGERCLFSRNVEIRTSDSHKIYKKDTKEQINLSADVVIGDHVWIAANSVVSKGAIVSDNSVIGAMSFVNKKFLDSNVILAGAPAKIIKADIDWER